MTPISRSALEKDPRPGPLFEGNPVGEGTTRRGTATPRHRPQRPASNFLEEISRLSHSVVFLYFFALIAEEGFLIFPCYSLELCIQMLNSRIP